MVEFFDGVYRQAGFVEIFIEFNGSFEDIVRENVLCPIDMVCWDMSAEGRGIHRRLTVVRHFIK